MLGGGERGEDTSSAWKIELEIPEPFSKRRDQRLGNSTAV